MNDRVYGLTMMRSAQEAQAGNPPGAASSMFKYYGTEQNKRRYELMLSMLGSRALGWEGEGHLADELSVTREWLRSKANSIEGGTSEVQLNIIAKRILGLPD
jgi:alkylation response protein AidB-like acyl-CoA dehydrogenase